MKTLASFYLQVDFSAEAVRPKSANTIPIIRHYVMDYLVDRWGNEIADDIKPFDIQKWLLSLHKDNGLAWTTVTKIRGIMHRVYKVGILHEHVTKNPLFAGRDTFQVHLPGYRHHPGADARHPGEADQPSALRTDAHLRRHGAESV